MTNPRKMQIEGAIRGEITTNTARINSRPPGVSSHQIRRYFVGKMPSHLATSSDPLIRAITESVAEDAR